VSFTRLFGLYFKGLKVLGDSQTLSFKPLGVIAGFPSFLKDWENAVQLTIISSKVSFRVLMDTN
jgi:hypothetical protein